MKVIILTPIFCAFLIWVVLNIFGGFVGFAQALGCETVGNGRWEYFLPLSKLINWLFMGCR